MMQTPILSLRSVSLSIGGKVIFGDGAVSVLRGDRIGLVGRKGTGKTTCPRLGGGGRPPILLQPRVRRRKKADSFCPEMSTLLHFAAA